jgi:hypothetical protein
MSWGNREDASSVKDWQRKAAWILAIVAVVFWMWFGVGSALVEGGGWFNWLMHILIPGGVFALGALIALRWQRVGGGLLALMGLLAVALSLAGLIGGRLTLGTALMMLLTLSLPPLLAGIFFLVDARGRRARSREGGPNR